MKTLFNYCFYRIAKAYKSLDNKNYCGWGYGVLFATFAFITLAVVALIMHFFHYKLTTSIIVTVFIPFIALDALFSILLNKEKKYIQLEIYYKDEQNSKLKGWLVFLYCIGSVIMYFVTLLLCGYWVSAEI